MKKSGKRTTKKKQDGESRDSAASESAAAGPNVYIAKVDTFVCSNESVLPHNSDKEASTLRGKTGDDFLVLLVKEILEKSPQNSEALHTLEELICDRIRALQKSKKNISSFKAYSDKSFRQFIEQNTGHFCLDLDGENLIVSTSKEKKKKKTEKAQQDLTAVADSINTQQVGQFVLEQPWHSDDEVEKSADVNQWETVSKRKGTRGSTRPSPEERGSQSKFVTADEFLIQSLTYKHPGDTLILRASEEPYKQDRSAFVKDVTCLWNTPDRGTAYILMGIKVRPELPHTVEGLLSSTDESVYQAMFSRHLLNVMPLFRYREIMYNNVRIGLIEVLTPNCGPPSVFTSDDLAASGLRKNQLMSRRNGKNILVMPADPLYKTIEAWFQGFEVQPAQNTKQFKDVPKPAAKASKSHKSEPSPAEKTQDKVVSSEQARQNQMSSKFSPAANYPETAVPSERNQTAAKLSPPQGDSYATKLVENKTKKLMEALSQLQRKHFVLVCGSMRISSFNVEALAGAPWVAVYDFNFLGRDNGLLSILEDGIMRRRSLSVLTWCDSCKGITEKGTQWWSLRGRREIPSSRTADETQNWFRTVKDKLEKLCLALTDFAADYTVLTLLLIWPDSEDEARCMHKFLTKLQEYMVFKLVILFADSTKDHSSSKAALLMRNEFDELEIEEFHVDLKEFCAEVERLTHSTRPPDKFQYRLPAAVESKTATLEEKDDAWLRQELDVLYLQSPYSKPLTEQDLNDEADIFFRGGTINWSTLYDQSYEHFDVKRVVAKDLITRIQKELKEDSRCNRVTLYHTPGAGGSTMTRRILWDLHESVPCVHVKQRSGASLDEIANRLVFLHEKCRTPILALMDGEDESRIKQLSKQLQRSSVVILYVKRYPYSSENIKSKEIVYLQGVVKPKESAKLLERYLGRCEGDRSKIGSLYKLNDDVKRDKQHEMYEYGMTVYLHEFKGVQAYVAGYLQLDENKQGELKPWQKCLCFLALVYYYGQSSLPCQFFVNLLGKPSNYKVDLEDFPHQVKKLVVKDDNEAKDQCIRIGHYVIAKEILEQTLTKNKKRTSSADRLSRGAMRNLKDLSTEFINETRRKKIRTALTSQTISYIITKTFIFRDNEEITDTDAREPGPHTKRKPQFSLIMTDLDPDPPFQGRLDILQKLCDTFPDNPNFKAHLGRFYTCCRPEAETEAEGHFKDALKLCHEQSQNQARDGPDSDFAKSGKLTLMHIYHMYGMFFQARIDRFIKYFESASNKSEIFEAHIEEIVDNANRACENFVNSRNTTPPGHEESYTYTNEIYVRLRTCDFVNRYSHEGLSTFLKPTARDGDSAVRIFVTESVTEVDSLIMECYDVQVDDMGVLQKHVKWLHALFGPCTSQLQTVVKPDLLTSLRLQVTATKLKFRHPDEVGWVDSVMPETEVVKLVGLLENVLKEAAEDHESDRRRLKNKVELDYKDWLLTIRHRHLKQVYSIEHALERVRQWHDQCHSPQSTYYLFVLLSMLGFGSSETPGNPECLVDAQMILEQMQKLSKLVLKCRFPREWLGRWDAPGVKRLVTNSAISHEDRRISSSSGAKLAVCKGTLHARFQRAAGFIDLDLGLNATPVKVFCIPGRSDLLESRHGGARVQFHLAFTIDKGYEAYEVRLLERYQCNNCPQKMEMTRDQEEVRCRGKGCNSIITKNEHSFARWSTPEDDLQKSGQ